MVDGKIVQRPVLGRVAAGRRRHDGYEFYVRLVAGRHVHAAAVAAAGRPPDADDRARRASSCSQPDDERTHLFISSGTGNAPFVSMMRQTLVDGRAATRPSSSTACRTRDELGYRDAARGLAGVAASTRSRTSRPSRGPTTRATRAGRAGRAGSRRSSGRSCDELGLTPANSIAYICGNPDMILAAEATLLERGYPEEQVQKELYWPKGKEPRGVAGADLAAAIDAAEANADQ